jgi:MFS superfamily sulfate permease-like transporter
VPRPSDAHTPTMRGGVQAAARAEEGPTAQEQIFFALLLIIMLLCVFRSLACAVAMVVLLACLFTTLTHTHAHTAAQEQQGGRDSAQSQKGAQAVHRLRWQPHTASEQGA